MAECAYATDCIYTHTPDIFAVFMFFGLLAGLFTITAVGSLMKWHSEISESITHQEDGEEEFNELKSNLLTSVVSILSMTPIFCITSLFMIFVPDTGPAMQLVQSVAVVQGLRHFLIYYITLHGGINKLMELVYVNSRGSDDSLDSKFDRSWYRQSPCCCLWWPIEKCDKGKCELNPKVFGYIRAGIAQFCIITPLLGFWNVLYYLCSPDSAHYALNIVTTCIQVVSTLFCIYTVNVFKELLTKPGEEAPACCSKNVSYENFTRYFETNAKYNFLFAHLLCIQTIGGWCNLFTEDQVLDNGDHVKQSAMVQAWQGFLTILVMMLMSYNAYAAFPVSDKIDEKVMQKEKKFVDKDKVSRWLVALGASDLGLFKFNLEKLEKNRQEVMEHLMRAPEDPDALFAKIISSTGTKDIGHEETLSLVKSAKFDEDKVNAADSISVRLVDNDEAGDIEDQGTSV